MFVDGAGSSILILLWEGRLWLRLLPFILSPGKAIDCVPGCILDLDVLLSTREGVAYLGDFMLHQVLVERVGDLQPTN